jgi:hypothetical protein
VRRTMENLETAHKEGIKVQHRQSPEAMLLFIQIQRQGASATRWSAVCHDLTDLSGPSIDYYSSSPESTSKYKSDRGSISYQAEIGAANWPTQGPSSDPDPVNSNQKPVRHPKGSEQSRSRSRSKGPC